jgi:hypothetical protein
VDAAETAGDAARHARRGHAVVRVGAGELLGEDATISPVPASVAMWRRRYAVDSSLVS